MNNDITILIKRRKKARRITIRIDESSNVVLSVPKYTSKEACEGIIRQNHDWIHQSVLQKREATEYFARQIESHKGEILLFGEWIALSEKNGKKFLRNALNVYLAKRVAEIAEILDTEYVAIGIRAAKNRWGSCSASKKLSFNLLLAFAPKWVIDYVITHELAHTKYHNHSKQYWEFVNLHTKDHRTATAFLKEHRGFYINMLEYLK